MMIKCDTCPRCKDTYPDKVDFDGNHFHIIDYLEIDGRILINEEVEQ